MSLPSTLVARPSSALTSFVEWVRTIALPYWADRGFDAVEGRFEEALDFDARPLALPYRAMVQARQIYVFSHAALLGWHDRGQEIAERAAETLFRDFRVDRGRKTAIAFATDRTGVIVAPALDAYTHAFVLFALAWLYRLNGERRILDIADRIHAFVAAELTDPIHGGLFDSLPNASRMKLQNPVMHLLEAYLALEEAAPGEGYLEHANTLTTLFERNLLHRGFVIESRLRDWKEAPDSVVQQRWEPGHHYEWAWLLEWHATLAGTGRSGHAPGLCRMARGSGHSANGLIYDELSSDLTVTASNHRLWPHAEAIKAALSRHSGSAGSPEIFAETMAERLMTCFLGRPFAGGWIDRIDPNGVALTDRVPASSLYHLMLAASEAARVREH